MLRLVNVCKSFKIGREKTVVLNKINLDFKKHEMVFILGRSGSGKSTLLNVIGGMLEVDSGNILLDDIDITKFNHNMMCSYRNNMVGYIFQDYHLVEYMSVIDNIRLGQTIKRNNNRIEMLLRKLGIYSKRKNKVSSLSGGEKQRVAIARAIVNNPNIILCDEPTGALDSNNGIMIMNILKELSRDKLVIVVSHDVDLANKYADRIINIKDGKVEYFPQLDGGKFDNIKKKKLNLLSILRLAIKNLYLKKWRTLFTAMAISLSFISMVIVLCLSKSFNDEIDKLEHDVVSVFPISVYNGDYEVVNDNKLKSHDMIIRKNKDDYIHTNKINSMYIDYVRNIENINYIGYYYDISMPIISDRYKEIDNNYFKVLPNVNLIGDNYDILAGSNINSIYDILLKVDSNNNVNSDLLDVFNIDDNVLYDDLIGRKLRIISNDNYYVKNGDYYFINTDNEGNYKKSDIELNIVGIVREKDIVNDTSCLYYSGELMDYIIGINSNSKIVLEQLKLDYNVLGLDMDKTALLSYLGYNTLPNGIDIYVSDINSKEKVLKKLDEYNKDNDGGFLYVDTMQEAIDILKNVINIITVILIVFSMIAILISSFMIFILTNNRVMERVKEIGILRSLGARCSDITRLFNIENFIIGIISFVIGIIAINFLVSPINSLIKILLESGGVFKTYIDIVIYVGIFNIFIVVLSGYIPSLIAGRKKIVSCLSNRI